MSDKDNLLQLDGVSFSYRDGRPVLEQVNYCFGRNFYLIEGPSGSGKSTLLRLLCGLELPGSGRIIYQNKALPQWDIARLRTKVSYVQQSPVLFAGTVRENLLLPFRFRSLSGNSAPDPEQLEQWLEFFRLEGVSLDDRADRLSGGQKQRLTLIRALLLEPEMLLLDEPTASLDPESKQVVERVVEQLNRERGLGIIMVSHQAFLPETVTARRIYIAGGRLEEKQ